MQALTGMLTLLAPKSALKKEGIDVSVKKVRIAGRNGTKRHLSSGKKGEKMTIAKDYTLAFPLLESVSTDKGITTTLRLERYRG